MSAEPVDELADLRRRAYGPDADIDGAALARLRELEAAARDTVPARTAPEVVSAEPRGGGAPSYAVGPDSSHGAITRREARMGAHPEDPEGARIVPEHPVPASHAAPQAPAGAGSWMRRLPRRIRVAWATSLVLAAVVAAGFTAWVVPGGVGDASGHAALLMPTAGEVPSSLPFVGEADPRSFGQFQGLHVSATSECLYATGEGFGAPFYGVGCVGDGLEPVLEVYVPSRVGGALRSDVTFPTELTDRYPDGAVVRFARHGDVVVVDVGGLPALYG